MDETTLEKLARGAKDLQERLARAQEETKSLRAEGEAGGGWVRVVIAGDHRVLRVEIADDAMRDKAMLQDLIASAVADAQRKMERKVAEKMRDVIPPGMPF